MLLMQLVTVSPSHGCLVCPLCPLACHLRDPGQLQHEAMACSLPHLVPSPPRGPAPAPWLGGGPGAQPERGSFPGQVASGSTAAQPGAGAQPGLPPPKQVWSAQHRGQALTLYTARGAASEGDDRGPGSLPRAATEGSGHKEAHVYNRPCYTARLKRSSQQPADTEAQAHPTGQGMEAQRGEKAA